MAEPLARGQLRLYTFKSPDKRRPVVVLTRDVAIPWLTTIMVAPVTSTIRGAPSEVLIGPIEGLKKQSAINLDHVQTVSKGQVGAFLGQLDERKMGAVCNALAIATGCA